MISFLLFLSVLTNIFLIVWLYNEQTDHARFQEKITDFREAVHTERLALLDEINRLEIKVLDLEVKKHGME